MAEGVTGIVLAGGRAARFGSDKLVADLDGQPLIHHALSALSMVTQSILVVAAPGRAPSIPPLLAPRVRVVHDPEPFGGPLAGLAAALSHVETPVVLVVGGDMPRMVPAVLQRLVRAVGVGGGEEDGAEHRSAREHTAVTLEVPDQVQPLPMALRTGPATAVTAALLGRGERSMRALLRELGGSSLPAAEWRSLDPLGSTIVDIDRPADLRS